MSIKDGTVQYKLLKTFKYDSLGKSNINAKSFTLCEAGIDHVEIYADIKDMITGAITESVQKLDPEELEKAKKKAKALKKYETQTTGKKFHEQAEQIDEEADISVEFIKLALVQADKSKTSTLLKLFKELVLIPSETKICLVDGVEPLTDVLFGRLSADDWINMAYTWAFFFGTPSEIREATSSDQQSKSVSQVKAE